MGPWKPRAAATRADSSPSGELADGVTPIQIPVFIVNGREDGPIVYLHAGSHGQETNYSVEMLRRLRNKLDPEKLKGAVIAVPLANLLAHQFATRVPPHYAAREGVAFAGDLHKLWPGDARGSMTQRIAHVLWNAIVRQCDCAVDLHAVGEPGMAFAFMYRGGKQDAEGSPAWDRSVAMAKAFGLTVVTTAPNPLTLAGACLDAGKPAFMVEMTKARTQDGSVVEGALRGTRNVFVHLGMLDGSIEPQHDFLVLPGVHPALPTLRAERGGFIRFEVECGAFLRAGTVIARTRDVFGREVEVIAMPTDGHVMTFPPLSWVGNHPSQPATSSPTCSPDRRSPGLKITEVESIILRQTVVDGAIADGSQDDLIVRVHTDEGIVGIGEVDSAPEVVKAVYDAPHSHYIATGLRHVLIGHDPLDIEGAWRRMYMGSVYYGRRGVAMHAMSGIDLALWDIRGKKLGKPVSELLGTKQRDRVRAYASLLMPDTEREVAARVGAARRDELHGDQVRLGSDRQGRGPRRAPRARRQARGRRQGGDPDRRRLRLRRRRAARDPRGAQARGDRHLLARGAVRAGRVRGVRQARRQRRHPRRGRRGGVHALGLSRADRARPRRRRSSPTSRAAAACRRRSGSRATPSSADCNACRTHGRAASSRRRRCISTPCSTSRTSRNTAWPKRRSTCS